MYDLLIVGGGASGLCAAINAAKRHKGLKLALLERLPRVAKKILATGNGRCNLTNLDAEDHPYKNKAFTGPAFEKYSVDKTLMFFKALGLLTFSDEAGRVYPLTNTAAAVSDALRFEAQRLNIPLITDCRVLGVELNRQGIFELSCQSRDKADQKTFFKTKKLIIAAGGMASPAQGSDGSAFKLLESLGHSIKTPLPSLTSLNSDSPFPKQLKGHRVRSTISVEANGLTIAFSEGEILFTDYGLSGIAAMDVSAAVSEHFAFSGGECRAVLDLVPSLRRHELLDFLRKLIASSPRLPLEKLFFGILPGSVGRVLCKSLGFDDFNMPSSELGDEDLIKLVESIKSFGLRLTGTQGFNRAQVTRGGAEIGEFDSASLESKLVKNLYACGEVLNVDGGCGGYNLQWAWSSGLLAGELN